MNTREIITDRFVSNPRWTKFANAFLATTCLSVAGGNAFASNLIVEGTAPAPSDFGNTQALAYTLPFGTNVVQGQLHQTTDLDDFVEFQGLAGGQSFSVVATYNPLGQERQVSYQVFNSLGTSLGIATLEGQGGHINGTIPLDGDLFVDVSFSSLGTPTWQVSLTAATATPEPATFGAVGLALAGALAWRRKRSTNA